MTRQTKDYAADYARFVLRHRRAVILLLFTATLLALYFVDRVNLRNDPDSLLPLSNRYIATNLYSDLNYGMGNLMVWGMKVKQGDIYQPWFIRMVDEFYRDVSNLAFANSANFIGIPSPKLRNIGITRDGNLDFRRLLPAGGLSHDSQRQLSQLAYLRNGLEKHLVLESLLVYYQDGRGEKCEMVGADGLISNASIAQVHQNCTAKGTFIIGDFSNELKDNHLEWIASAKGVMADYQARYGDRVEFHISGEPYFLASMVQELWDKAWLFGVSLLIILLVLWYEFRHWSCAVLPLLGVGMTIILTLGLMGYTQFRLTTMMALTPMLLLAIGIGHSMQITRRFMQELHHTRDPEQAALASIRHTIVPAALSIGTDLHGFFAISFIDISFYKAYAYFGIFGMSTLILTTTTLIPLLMVTFPPRLRDREHERGWEMGLANGLTRILTGPAKWLPVVAVIAIWLVSAYMAELDRGFSALLAGEAGRTDPEVARIQDEFDIMPGVEKGIHYPRAAYKDHYLLGALLEGDGEVKAIADLEALSEMMPGVITANMVVRSKQGVLPPCGMDAWNRAGERLLGADRCFDELADPPQGIFNRAEVLGALSTFEDWLRSHPNIGYTASYVQFVKTLNMVLNAPPGEPPTRHMNLYAIPTIEHMRRNAYAYRLAGRLPDPDKTVQLYNGMLDTSAVAGELDSFINTRTWDEGIIVGFVNTMDPRQTHQTIRDIQHYLRDHAEDPGMDQLIVGIQGGERIEIPAKDKQPRQTIITDDSMPGKAAIGGFLGITEATRDVAFKEWLNAPVATSLTVFIMTLIMFRSWMIACILISLCFITLMTQYGLGAYMSSIGEWSANLAFHVQVALSIAMGLGVDYGVYMVSRLREEMSVCGGEWRQALRTTLGSTGSAIVISMVVLVGSFIPLMNTELANLWSVSLYISEALIMDVFIALMVLPLMVYWLRPGFVFRQGRKISRKDAKIAKV
ncbi:MAG: MMPL family transporter [Candidatus Thiodiazotropha sp. (ex Epidulcina cf. delphinae)]|nr:MMPL family transporter [Candidatus Thiodiazotropha sp. (ex Epidulcina cf. delphinae)]